MAYSAPSSRYLDRPSPSGLADVVDLILDKGLVIDIYLRVSLVGIELLTVDARIVVASVDTYLRFAEAVNRLDLREKDESQSVPELLERVMSGGVESGAESKTKGAIEGAKDKVTDAFGGDDEDEDEGEQEEQEEKPKQRRQRKRSSS
jgi:gas vesicle structural protein